MDEPVAKKRRLAKTFQHQWYDQHPEWREWVRDVPSEKDKFYCVACRTTLSCGHCEIDRHSKSGVHEKNMRLLDPGSFYFVDTTPSASVQEAACTQESFSADSEAEVDFDEQVQIAENRFTTFLAEHNIAMNIAPDMLNLFQIISKEPAVLQAMTVGKTKANKYRPGSELQPLHKLKDMVNSCCIKNCKSVWTKNGHITFHSFPKDPELQMAFVSAMPPNSVNKITKFSKICSRHFTFDSFQPTSTPNLMNRLKKNAVPTLFGDDLISTITTPADALELSTNADDTDNEMIVESLHSESSDNLALYEERISNDSIHSEMLEKPKPTVSLEGKKEIGTQTSQQYLPPSDDIVQLRKKIRVLQKRLRRREIRIKTMSDLIRQLKKKGPLLMKNSSSPIHTRAVTSPVSVSTTPSRSVSPALSTSSDIRETRQWSSSRESNDFKRIRNDENFDNIISEISQKPSEQQAFCNYLQFRLEKLQRKYAVKITNTILLEIMKVEAEQNEEQE